MKMMALILILFSFGFGDVYAQGSLNFGDEGQGYGNEQGYGDQGGQGQGQKQGGTGLERKKLDDKMKVMEYTELTEAEKCKTKCNMGFSNCYRMKSDRGQCYKDQQECLGNCGGEQEPGFGEDPSGGQGGGEYGF
jgi:hypothetical protein